MKLLLALGALSLMSLLSACSTGYVLETKYPKSFFANLPFIASAKESEAIPSVKNISIYYDREERVLYEDAREDGSVWVNYAVIVKNGNKDTPQAIGARGTHVFADNVEVERVMTGGVGVIDSISTSLAAADKKDDKAEKKDDKAEKKDDKKDEETVEEDSKKDDEKKEPEKKAEERPKEPEKKAEPPKKISIESEKYPAVFESKGLGEWVNVKPGAYLRLACKFHLAKGAVKKYANSRDPLQLIVPLQGKDALKLNLWLWKIK